MKLCARCGGDVPVGQQCEVCPQKRSYRHPGYDDPLFRKVKREKRRARRLCERCHRHPGEILHHADGDPGHNVRSNYVWACLTCAAVLDVQMREMRKRKRDGGKPSPWK